MALTSHLHIETGVRNGQTFLKSAYHTHPFKVMDITEDKNASPLHLMVMNASPGILDGDEHRIRIDLAEESALQLHTQSYQRLFSMKQQAAQHTEVHMAAGSSFCFLPHPVVPHRASVFSAVNKIYVSKDCVLLWGEVLTCGRKECGEQFQFSRYSSRSEFFVRGRLVARENLLLQPDLLDVQALGQLEGFTHQATLICLNEREPIEDKIDKVRLFLSRQSHILYGVSALPVSGLSVRLLGNKSEPLYGLLKEVAALLAEPEVSKEPLNLHTYAC